MSERVHEGVGGLAENKRFVSYMYQYQRDEKQGNVGYARIEGRGSQCKVFIHISLPKVEGKLLKAYMFYRKPGKYRFAYLGNILVSGGTGELKIRSDASNVMNSDLALNDMCGIIVYQDRADYLACEWDDEPITHSIIDHIENPDLHPSLTSDAKVKAEPKEEAVESEPTLELESTVQLEPTVVFNPVEEQADVTMENYEALMDSASEVMATEIADCEESVQQETAVTIETLKLESLQEEADTSHLSEPQPELLAESLDVQKGLVEYYNRDFYENQRYIKPQGYQNIGYGETVAPRDIEVHDLVDLRCASVDCIEPTYRTRGESVQARTDGSVSNQKQTQFTCHPIAENIFRKFQRVYPFEDHEITDCVRIEPQDIGLLPIDAWVLGNNSFLLHGYYTYHHLIFGKIVTPTGLVYIIGVPGIYKNRESFMARMFGFEYFKCCKVKEEKQGEFGYYYMPIQIG